MIDLAKRKATPKPVEETELAEQAETAEQPAQESPPETENAAEQATVPPSWTSGATEVMLASL